MAVDTPLTVDHKKVEVNLEDAVFHQLVQPKPYGKNEQRLKLASCMTVLSFVLVLGCVIFTAVVVLHQTDGVTTIHHYLEDNTEACVDCMMLTTDPATKLLDDPLLKKLKHVIKNKKDMCCAANGDQLSVMLEAVMRSSRRPMAVLPTYNVSDFMFSPVSAHKRIYPEKIIHETGEIKFPQTPSLCHFRTTDPAGLEHHRGVEVLDIGLKVKYSGLYFVYSNVEYMPQSSYPCGAFTEKTFMHYVTRMSTGFLSRTLLKTSHTCCDDCRNTPESRFAGGLFLLQAGDIIQVKVSGTRLVYFHPESSYAGLAMLGTVPPEQKNE